MIASLAPYTQRRLRMISRIKLKYILIFAFSIFVLDFFGAFTHVFELSYDTYFKYPYEGDIHSFIDSLKHRKKPEMDPINDYNYSYIHDLKDFCVDTQNDFRSLRIVFLVKSSAEHFQRRVAIRNTWGFKKRFFDVPTRTVFLLGIHENDEDLQKRIDEESEKFKDILQANFIDSYFNNTIKTMIGFKWAYNHCRNSKFYMFVDDDIYVSVKNVLRFIRNPAYYPEYLKDPNRLVKRASGRQRNEADHYDTVATPEDNDALMDMEGIQTVEMPTNILKTERTTVREKILMRQREGWKHHNKSMPDQSGRSGEIEDVGDGLFRDNQVPKDSSGIHEGPLVGGNVIEVNNPLNYVGDSVNQSEEVPKVLSRIARATAREKILMRRKEGWKSHNKTRMPIADDQSIKMRDEKVDKKLLQISKVQKLMRRDRSVVVGDDQADLVNRFNNSMLYKKLTRGRRQVLDFELPDDVKLFAGYVFVSSPHRHKSSKWYVSLEEYPYDLWPPYVTAGAYILSKAAMIEMYLTSLYTQHFRFDDIYLGLVAKKADIEPFHCDEFHFYKKDYTKYNYKYVISSHGYGDPGEMQEIWNEQKGMGNA
ncbi:beta-1,3-galactosyltransferase brn [Diachasmimorpha longicaudata]|uniref:beta-1,3-galactosyltransferase brn n=1 Tax=Diachasmimorpha longicaudata TaxID=58733 RepID=UPI0030B8DE31